MLIFLFWFLHLTFGASYAISFDQKKLTISASDSDNYVTKEKVAEKSYKDTLESVEIKQGIISIHEGSFKNYARLISVLLPVGLKTIESDAFMKCTALKSIEFPYGIEIVDGSSLSECNSLENITIPSTLKSFVTFGLSGCQSISKFIFPTPNPVFSASSDGKILIKNGNIAICAPGAFKKITIPDYINIINAAFINGQKNISKIDFGKAENLTRIESQAFRSSNITSIKYPRGIEYLGSSIFFGGKNLEYVWIPNTLKSFDDIFDPIPKVIEIEENCSCLYKDKATGIIYDGYQSIIYVLPNTIDHLNISDKISKINGETLRSLTNLSKLTVSKNNSKLSDYKDILYNNDKTILLTCPGGVKIVNVNVNCQIISESAFEGLSLKSVTFEGSNLTTVSEFAFRSASIELPLVIPNGTTILSRYSFLSAKISEIIFPSTIINLSSQIFYNNIFTSVNLSHCTSIDYIPNFCFQSCGKLKTLLLPPNIVSLGMRSLQTCSSLVSIVIPSKVRRIDTECFINCYKLSKVTFEGDNVEIIDSLAFYNCNLSQISIPINLKILTADCFANNRFLSTVEIDPESELEAVQIGAFRNCPMIENLTFGKKFKSISGGCFSGMVGLQNIKVHKDNTNFDEDNGILYSSNFQTLIAFPCGRSSYLIHPKVKEFGNGAFYSCTKLRSVTAPTSSEGGVKLESIQSQSFLGCIELKSINIPESVRLVHEMAFCNCSKLENVIFEGANKVTTLISTVFSGCAYLKRVIFSESSNLEVIEESVFYGMINLEEFSPSMRLKTIGSNAFNGCKNLKSFKLNTISYIGDSAFYGCSELQYVELGENLSYLGKDSFSACKNIKKVVYCGTNTFSVPAFVGSGVSSAFVSDKYRSERFGEINAIKIIDSDCNFPTNMYTAVAPGGNIKTLAGISLINDESKESLYYTFYF